MKLLVLFFTLLLSSALFAQPVTNRDSILQQMKWAAKQGLIDKYYPLNIDTLYGGYLSTFTYDFQPQGEQDKMIVTQARHTWSTAKAAMFYHDTSYISLSRHGFYFLRDKMWDQQYGGFYNLVIRKGEPKTFIKQAYGNGFGIYALAAYYECSGDTAALNLAKKAFLWLENHSHDARYKGYFQYLQRDGTPVQRTAETPSTSDVGYKDQNSSIHLLEAFTELYKVWRNPLVRARLEEMLLLIRDTIVTPKGYLQLYFTPQWKPVSYRDSSNAVIAKHHYIDHVSFGHDVETAYLMQEADETLNNKASEKTLAIGKKMVDHALRNGWDDTLGGFYDEGYYYKNKPGITITLETKNWWAQAEGLNTLLLFSDMYPNDAAQYYQRFTKLWSYVQTYLIDHEHGDWYEEGLDKAPEYKTRLKAQIWKGSYHNFRALMNCINRIDDDKRKKLTGNSIQQHDFLYAGEWQNSSMSNQAMYIVKNGTIVWSYTMPQEGEFGDATLLSNGNIVFSRKSGASEITSDKKIIWNYDAPPNSEIHTCQPIGSDKVFIVVNAVPAKAMIINTKTNAIEKQITLPTGGTGTHGMFRHCRYTKEGTFLIAHMDMNKVVEYDSAGKAIWSVNSPSPWAAVRLKNGNTLISGNSNGFVREVDKQGKTVWEYTRADAPCWLTIYTVQEADRLENGNTIISNWIGGGHTDEEKNKSIQFFEVTPDKKIVWALSQWQNPNLNSATAIQLLNEKGVAENGDLQR